MANYHELEMMTDLSKSLFILVGLQENPILPRTPCTNSNVDTTSSMSMHTNPAVMETKTSQNWIWFSLEGFGLLGSHTSLETIQLVLTQAIGVAPCRIQQLDHQKMLTEFPIDASNGQLCWDILNIY